MGNAGLGAPNLSRDDWLCGGSKEDIEQSIAFGRFGHMPAFEDRLDDTQLTMLPARLTLAR